MNQEKLVVTSLPLGKKGNGFTIYRPGEILRQQFNILSVVGISYPYNKHQELNRGESYLPLDTLLKLKGDSLA